MNLKDRWVVLKNSRLFKILVCFPLFLAISCSIGFSLEENLNNLAVNQQLAGPKGYNYEIVDLKLKPVKYDNRPVIYSLTGYNATELDAISPYRETPLFRRYQYSQERWWHNLIDEQMQARMPVIQVSTRGNYYTNTEGPLSLDGPSEYQPQQWKPVLKYLDETYINSDILKFTCFVDTPMIQRVYNTVIRGQDTTNNRDTKGDLANTNSWESVWWLRTVKPWFETFPRDRWFFIDGRPIITFWNSHPGNWNNLENNWRRMMDHVANRFEDTYGIRPWFIVRDDTYTSANQDPSVITQKDLFGLCGWFEATDSEEFSYSMWDIKNKVSMAVPGFIDYKTIDINTGALTDLNRVIWRNNLDGTGVTGDTMRYGLEQAYIDNTRLLQIEGWTDLAESAGLYRSEHENWLFPNQYINMISKYTDLKKETVKLQLEGCDRYEDSTFGNRSNFTSPVFRRQGDLDISQLNPYGWKVSYTSIGEWVQFDKYYLPTGNYKFYLRYASPSRASFSLTVDGIKRSIKYFPETGSPNNFRVVELETLSLLKGDHDIKLTFENGSGDGDWIFIERLDKDYTLKSKLNGNFLKAEKGGNDKITANGINNDKYNEFMITDINGGDLISNDSILIQVFNGFYIGARSGGNKDIYANRMFDGGWEKFTVIKINENEVAFKSQTGFYIQVLPDGNVDVKGTSINNSTTFIIKEVIPESIVVIKEFEGDNIEAEDCYFNNGSIKENINCSSNRFVDLNESGSISFSYFVSNVEMNDVFSDIEVYSYIPGGSSRSMGLFVNDIKAGIISSIAYEKPEKTIIQNVLLKHGENIIEILDTEKSFELNIDKIVIKQNLFKDYFKYEAEDSVLSKAFIKDGASGKYVDGENNMVLTFNHIENRSKGKIDLDISIFVPSGVRTVGLWVNDSLVSNIESSSTTPEIKTIKNINILKGTNKIQILDTANGNEPNIDYFIIKNFIIDKTTKIEAESGIITGRATIKQNSNCSGNLYVDMENNSSIDFLYNSETYNSNFIIQASTFVPSGYRSVGLFVNDIFVKAIDSSNISSIPEIWEVATNVSMFFGNNKISILDSENSGEPNIDYIVIVENNATITWPHESLKEGNFDIEICITHQNTTRTLEFWVNEIFIKRIDSSDGKQKKITRVSGVPLILGENVIQIRGTSGSGKPSFDYIKILE